MRSPRRAAVERQNSCRVSLHSPISAGMWIDQWRRRAAQAGFRSAERGLTRQEDPMRLDRHLRLIPGLAAACLAAIVATSPAGAAEKSVTVFADQAKVLNVPGRPSSVIVGNPMIADVSLQGEVMAVHGRHFGTTNVIVL